MEFLDKKTPAAIEVFRKSIVKHIALLQGLMIDSLLLPSENNYRLNFDFHDAVIDFTVYERGNGEPIFTKSLWCVASHIETFGSMAFSGDVANEQKVFEVFIKECIEQAKKYHALNLRAIK